MSLPFKALQIYAGPRAMQRLRSNGLQATDVRIVPAAAGGPKGLILGPLDRFIFGSWLAQSQQSVHLVGASIGAWRMATACMTDAVSAFERLERDYIHQEYALEPGKKRPTPDHISERFGVGLREFFGAQVPNILHHPRYKLHVVTSRGRHVLAREGSFRTPIGYFGAFLSNAVSRRALGIWLDRVVFSQVGAMLPFEVSDMATQQVTLNESNFAQAIQASCSIPFVLRAVPSINGAPPGAYWDGGITDYHLHLKYAINNVANNAHGYSTNSQNVVPNGSGVVLYPHFQHRVVPGWLDKGLKWRHKATSALDDMVLLAPKPAWVAQLPNGKLPDRTDFARYAADLPARVDAWQNATRESCRLADEFAQWLHEPDMLAVQPL